MDAPVDKGVEPTPVRISFTSEMGRTCVLAKRDFSVSTI